MNAKGFPHRGRFQAQGGRGRGIEESEPWAQDVALTAKAGHRLLTNLKGKLSAADKTARQEAFRAAHKYINHASMNNGIGPIKKSFFKRPNPNNERVDLEVIKGLAFVP